MIMYYFCLLAVVAISAYIVIRDKVEYKEFKKAKSAKKRLAFYKSWLVKSYVMLGLPAVLILVLLQETSYIFHPIWSNETTRSLHKELSSQSIWMMVTAVLIGATIGVMLLGIVTYMKTRRTQKISTGAVGDIESLLPRNSAERRYCSLLAIGAGLNEELLYRVAVPVILLGIWPNPTVAIVLSILAFGLMHIYQGIPGVVGATLSGMFLMYLYIITGNIFASILFHIFIDMNGLVIQPLIARYALKNNP